MSEDINFDDYKNIAKTIKNNLNFDGIIVTHGTDTLAFTSAAMAFVFENINIPVIFVGSQRSSDRGSADSAMNLICAFNFIANTDFVGIAICMHHSQNDDICAILSPTKTRKMHTSRRDAFKSINDEPIALIDYKSKKINFLKEYNKKSNKNNLIFKNGFSTDVGLLKTHPNIKTELIKFYTKNYKAFILENTGLGHAPTNTKENEKNYILLENFIKNKGIIGITSQCLYGRVHSNVYSNLRRLSKVGCIFCEDMLPETAYIKLCWLLENYPDKINELLNKNLRDEISKRSTTKNYIE
jgi:glutamyl-tRNA(Gln) amidotransferase subunit D